MKPIQQRRPFPAAAKSEVKAMIESQRTLQESRFQPWGWIVAVSAALLLISCTRVRQTDATVALAGQSAECGARAWLKEHPDHRQSFELIAQACRIEVTNEARFAEFMGSLPTATLCGDSGAVYVSEPHILVHDGKRAVIASQKARKATLAGLKRGMAPLPPMPQRVRSVRNGPQLTNAAGERLVLPIYTPPLPVHTNDLPASDAALDAEFAAYLLTKTNRVGIYRVEKREAGETNWIQINGFTSGTAAEFRVRRVK